MTRTPVNRCPNCSCKVDAATSAQGDYKPESGDFSMCFKCGVILVFAEDLTVRKPTEEEAARAREIPLLAEMQIIRAGMNFPDLRTKPKK